MTEKAEIKKIVLDLGGVEVAITFEQAKKLHGILDEMFGSKFVNVPSYPIIIDRYRPYWFHDGPYWSSNEIQWTYTANDCTAKLSI
jgi:hypothetical protein